MTPVLGLPLVLTAPQRVPFVERPEQWDRLEQAWSAARQGGRQVLLVGGEAGAGKTRLITEFAQSVHDDGDGVVLYGSCAEHASLPYEPFAAALEHAARSLGEGFARAIGAAAGEVVRIVPQLALGDVEPARPGPGDADGERFRFFSAVVTALGAIADGRPLLFVIDDLHWAEWPTMQLVDHLSRNGPAGLCIVATYRSTPADASEAFRRILPTLRSRPGADRILLGNFDAEGVQRFVEAASGHRFHIGLTDVVAMLEELTGGNALLLGESWRHLVDSGYVVNPHGRWRLARPLAELESPEGVREVVAARTAKLPETTRDLLHLASALGDTFGAGILAAAAESDLRETGARLEPAVQAGIVEPLGRDGFRFQHALVRRSVYDGLGRAARQQAHLDIAGALRRETPDAVTEIAYHLVAAVPLGPVDEAVAAARAAARRATASVAHADAARQLDAVLSLVPDDPERCRLLLESADAHMRAGDVDTAQERCSEADQRARSAGDHRMQIAAAMAYDEANWRAARHGATAEVKLRAALAVAEDELTTVRLRAALGRSLAFTDRGAEAWEVSRDALEDATATGDPETVRLAYTAVLFAPWAPQTIAEQVRAARGLLDLGAREGNPEWELWALDKLIFGLITTGDLEEVRGLLPRHHQLAEAVGQPLFHVLDLQAHALIAAGEGRFDEAEQLAEAAERWSPYLSGDAAAGGYGVQLFSLRREQGRLEEARPMVETIARLGEESGTWEPALCVLYAELGLREQTARKLGDLVGDGLAKVPRDSLWAASLTYLADAAFAVDDRDAAAVLYDELLPYRGLVVQAGNFLGAYGAADLYLGQLAAQLGRHREAERHLEAALRLNTLARMPVWIAHARFAFGRFLAGRGQRVGTARELLALAERDGAAHGMRPLAAAAADELARMTAAPPDRRVSRDPVTNLTAREMAVLRLLVEGSSNREIGAQLQISQHTASNHVRAILLKTGCANRTEAVGWAYRNGVVPR